MGRLIGGMLDNESPFGRIMGKCLMIIGANVMFVIACLPVVTIGPALTALYYCMLKCLHTGGYVNPVKTFWEGFRMNFRQAFICFLSFAFLMAFLLVDIRFCMEVGKILTLFKYPLEACVIILLILAVYMVPVMASFEDTIPHLLRNALFFASRRPLKIFPALALIIVPVAMTILDARMRPLYGFLWSTCLAGLVAMLESELLFYDIEAFLPDKGDTDRSEDSSDNRRKSQREILKEMRKLDEN